MRTNGTYTRTLGRARLQVYWPEVIVTRTEFTIRADTAIRLEKAVKSSGRYFGVGLVVLGFGLGFDHLRPFPPPERCTCGYTEFRPGYPLGHFVCVGCGAPWDMTPVRS